MRKPPIARKSFEGTATQGIYYLSTTISTTLFFYLYVLQEKWATCEDQDIKYFYFTLAISIFFYYIIII